MSSLYPYVALVPYVDYLAEHIISSTRLDAKRTRESGMRLLLTPRTHFELRRPVSRPSFLDGVERMSNDG